MSYRIINICGLEVIRPYDPCPDCGEDMQSIVFVGPVCWNCYDKKNEEEAKESANDRQIIP